MRLYEVYQNIRKPIMEGGNVFSDAVQFDHSNIDSILATVNKYMQPTGAKLIPIGSGATPTAGKKSGDLDVIVDQGTMSEYFQTDKPKEIKQKIQGLFDAAGFDTKMIGINVHVRVPLEQGSAQVDIMLVPDAENISKFHLHDIPKDSPYKGKHKQIAMSKLANANGMMWSGFQGLFARDDAGKKAELISSNLDEIAKALIGPQATAKDLGSVESILAALDPQRADQLKAELEADPAA
jgi:hypothetical protein